MRAHAFWVICPVRHGRIISAAYELIGKARQLADVKHNQLIALILGYTVEVNTAIYAGADVALTVETEPAVWDDDSATGTVIAQILEDYKPEVVLFVADTQGRCIAPWVAATLKTGLTADCTDLSINEDGLLLQTRPAFGGSLLADILCREARPQMASVRPKIFPKTQPDLKREGRLLSIKVPPPVLRVRRLGFEETKQGAPLQEAELIIAGGKGIGSRAGFEKLHHLAELLNGAVGATRAAVDAGFADYSRQIGQTGVIVRPKVYLALGVSGQVQHIVGISGAKCIIAVNNDRQAPIYSYSDYGIVADWEAFVDQIIARLDKER